MQKKTYSFSSSRTACYFEASFAQFSKVVEKDRCVFVTDQHVFDHQKKYFEMNPDATPQEYNDDVRYWESCNTGYCDDF